MSEQVKKTVKCTVTDLCVLLRKQALPHVSRDDWGVESERACQLLEAFEKEFGTEIIELLLEPQPPHL